MDADTLNLTKIFKLDVRYVVPLFQRPYVWNEDDHWMPLWEDIRVVAERILEAGVDPDEEASIDEDIAPHFLGAVVIDQIRKPLGEITPWSVIDGQQRLTTLQIVMDAARDVADEMGFGRQARLIGKLLHNDEDLIVSSEERYKIWPTNADREAFVEVMSKTGETDGQGAICQANAFFIDQLGEWIREVDDEDKRRARVSAVSSTLRHHLKVVVISLEEQDNAQVIFETLNARGTPLLASDLVKNLLFQRLAADGANVEALYDKYWRTFDSDYWRAEITQGRLRRPRLDVFLFHWLKMRTERELVAHQVFPEFKRFSSLPESDPEELLADLAKSGQTYSDLEGGLEGAGPWEWNSPEGQFYYRMGELEAGTTLPLLLWIAGEGADQSDPAELEQFRNATESFLYRRAIARYTTKPYNRLFLDLLRDIKADPEHPGSAAVRFFSSSGAESSAWPSDADIRTAFVGAPLYKQLRRSRMRILLEALERAKRSRHSEPLARGAALTIEHVLPQSWEKHWPLEEGDPDELAAKLRRDELVHTIGNLTLLTASLNAAQSNGPWDDKRVALSEHSLLRLNHELCEHPGLWDEESILERGNTLADLALSIWPGPTADWIAAQAEA